MALSYEGNLEELKAGALDLASAWDAVAHHCGNEPTASSQCAKEAASLPASVVSPQQLTRAIAQDAAIYVTAANQHLRTLAHLLGPEIVLTGWSVTRSLAEYCGRAAWLLSPGASPADRIARFYMERIVSLHMAKMSVAKIGDKEYANELKQKREELLNQAKQIFPDIKLFKIEELNDWAVGGELYAGLGKAVNDFNRDYLDTHGLYDMLSTFTHPSLYRLRAQTKVTELEDRLHYGFIAEPEVIHWQFALACGSVYKAAHHVVGYLELDDAPLVQWADRHPALLGSMPSTDEVAG